jgi:hypothetical protein
MIWTVVISVILFYIAYYLQTHTIYKKRDWDIDRLTFVYKPFKGTVKRWVAILCFVVCFIPIMNLAISVFTVIAISACYDSDCVRDHFEWGKRVDKILKFLNKDI